MTGPHGLASGVSPSDEIFSPWTVRTSGSRSWSGGPLGAADPGVEPCRNARAEIRAAVPIDTCGSTPAAGPLRYLKAPSFWYSPSMPPQAGRFPAGGPGASGAVGRRIARFSAPAMTGHVQPPGAPILEPTRAIALPLPVIPDLSEFIARPLSTPPLVLHTSLTSPERGNFRNSIL